MKLNDFQSLSLLSRFRVPVASSFFVKTEEEIDSLLAKYELQEGVVQFDEKEEILCSTREELSKMLKDVFQCRKDRPVLVKAPMNVEYELYLAVTLDKKTKEHVVLSARGRKKAPDEWGRAPYLDIYREIIPPNKQIYTFQKMGLFHALRLPESMRAQYFQIIDKIVALYFATDALLVEANPLAVTYPMKLLVSRASIHIDDYALYRQTEMRYFVEQNEVRTKEAELKKMGIFYGSSAGDIGIMATGKDLLQGLVHLIRQRKGTVGSFVALGEEADEESFLIGLKALLEEKSVRVVLLNIFQGLQGGKNRAKTLVALLQSIAPIKVPIVLRMEAAHMGGIKEILSHQERPVHLVQTLKDAISLTFALLKK